MSSNNQQPRRRIDVSEDAYNTYLELTDEMDDTTAKEKGDFVVREAFINGSNIALIDEQAEKIAELNNLWVKAEAGKLQYKRAFAELADKSALLEDERKSMDQLLDQVTAERDNLAAKLTKTAKARDAATAYGEAKNAMCAALAEEVEEMQRDIERKSMEINALRADSVKDAESVVGAMQDAFTWKAISCALLLSTIGALIFVFAA